MELKDVKQQFFTYRNGMLADRLRLSGDGHKTIFGLNLPQIVDISKTIGKDDGLAKQLWANDTVRESRLLAPMVCPAELLSVAEAKQWLEAVENEEVADVLCHRLLRYVDCVEQLCRDCADAESDMVRYTALRLALNLLVIGKACNRDLLYDIAEKELARDCSITKAVATSIIEEFEDEG